MTLKIETHYTTKEGEEIQLKIPKVSVMGKLMDDDEIKKFRIISGMKTWAPNTANGYPNYTMMADTLPSEHRVSLQFSKQAMKEVDNLKYDIGNTLVIKKDFIKNNKTGAMMPIIKASIEEKQGTPSKKPKDTVQSKIPEEAIEDVPEKKAVHTTPSEVMELRNTIIDEDVRFATQYRQVALLDKESREKISENHFIGTYFRHFFPSHTQMLSKLYDDEVEKKLK